MWGERRARRKGKEMSRRRARVGGRGRRDERRAKARQEGGRIIEKG